MPLPSVTLRRARSAEVQARCAISSDPWEAMADFFFLQDNHTHVARELAVVLRTKISSGGM